MTIRVLIDPSHLPKAVPLPARKLVVMGDTSDGSGAADAARDCDLLVHEATFHSSLADKAISSGHSTGPMAAKFALSINARQLALTHFSSRHTGEGVTPGVREIEQETKEVFGPNVVAACDFMELSVETRNLAP